MTVLELIKKRPMRSLTPPDSMFEAEDESGKKHLFCVASFSSRPEVESLVDKYPTLPNWVVTKEHFTQEELDAIKLQC